MAEIFILDKYMSITTQITLCSVSSPKTSSKKQFLMASK